ncbi:PREDICTED: uncharacterized protein LOC109585824 [Amphimedon queenslandica]|uniref:c-SKI SMAD4-binding domain-containing protein n=1 Tax=Amphimedon queenslandica TaxID=400682 RepID=A0A1X7TW31_AMPQE|nr:PREDICTED: uncharacterized protein LOC109585824 [Amphimedon queenslandica]|eukprot:XP_019857526.1 PREDICTED: uncharacterized protein LOC109585824 [Amphimedon queenslandica]
MADIKDIHQYPVSSGSGISDEGNQLSKHNIVCLPTSQVSKTDELTSHSLSPYYKPLVVSPSPSSDHAPSINTSLAGPVHLFNEATPTNPPLLLGGNEPTPTSSNQSFIKGATSSPAPPINSPAPPVTTSIGPGVSLAVQLCPVGPKERCTPSQAQAMGQQVLSLMVSHDNDKQSLPFELQNTFDVFHRCLAVAYGTFFINLYTKANAPCLLCHGCKSLYPPGQYIHHSCPALPPNIVPCRSRMWRRCLVPLVSQDIDKKQQKERWKFVIEKFSHTNMGVVRRNRAPIDAEPNILDMPECKRGRFLKSPADNEGCGHYGTNNSCDIIENSIEDVTNNSISVTINSNSVTNNSDDVVSDGKSGSPQFINNEFLINQAEDCEGSGEDSSELQDHPTHRAVEVVEELVGEIKRLDNQLQVTRNELKETQKQLNIITKSSNLSDQLIQSLSAQDALTAERDRAIERARAAERRVAALERHIYSIQKLQDEVLS